MFSINQKVVCVDDVFSPVVRARMTAFPVKDKVYVIRDIIDGGTIDGEPAMAVYLVGLQNPSSLAPPFAERGFHERRFRPLDTVPPVQEKETEKVLVGVEFGDGRDTSEDWKRAA